MALTKVTGQVIKNTTDVTVGVLTVTNTLAVGGTVSVGGTLTYEDVTNVDAVGIITARSNILVGSGITLSPDGNIFATGVTTSTSGIVDSTLTAGRVVFVDSDKSLTDNSALTYAVNGELQIRGTGEGGPQVFRDGGNGPDMTLHGSRGTIASPTASAGTDLLGNINFAGYDGSAYLRRASINGIIDGTVVDGSDTLPVAILFKTGTTSATERLRITSAGLVGVNCTPAGMLEVQKNGIPSIISNYNSSKHLEMSVGGSGGGFKVTDGNHFAVNHQPYADRGTDSNLTERLRIKSDGKIQLSSATDNIIHTSSNSSRLRLFGGSNESVSNGAVLTLHGVSHSAGNYADLAAATGGHIQFRVGTSEKLRITSAGFVGISTITPNA